MTAKIFTTTEVASITGFTRQQLDYYANQQFVVPSIRRAHGKGSRRLYSLDDLVLLRFIRRLKDHKWSLQKIRTALAELRTFMAEPQEAVLIDGKGTILALLKTQAGERIVLDTLRPGGQQVLKIVLETLIQETIQDAERFAHEVVTHA